METYTAAEIDARFAAQRQLMIFFHAAFSAWTAQPAAITEFFGNAGRRQYADLTGYTQFRFTVRIGAAGPTNGVIRPQFSTDDGATWADFNATLSNVNLSVATIANRRTAWLSLPTTARADILLRVVGESGDGTTNSNIGMTALHAR